MYISLSADVKDNESFLHQMIENDSLKIQQTRSDDHEVLSNLFASRAECLLVLGDNEKAVEDFSIAYDYANLCGKNKQDLTFRPLFGAFLAYIRLENLEYAQNLYKHLHFILSNSCYEKSNLSSNFASESPHSSLNPIIFIPCESNYPIFGPDAVSIQDCVEFVEGTANALKLLVAAVKRPEVVALATTVINELQRVANNCCRAGGIWKGCLQKLVNRLHFWKESGVPPNPS